VTTDASPRRDRSGMVLPAPLVPPVTRTRLPTISRTPKCCEQTTRAAWLNTSPDRRAPFSLEPYAFALLPKGPWYKGLVPLGLDAMRAEQREEANIEKSMIAGLGLWDGAHGIRVKGPRTCRLSVVHHGRPEGL
jgi:hypothetical protein